MTTNKILLITFSAIALAPILIILLQVVFSYIYPPRKFTIVSRKSGKVVTFNMRGNNDPKEMLEFGKVFFGLEN